MLFLPDIDKWEKWDRELVEVLAEVDRAYVDGTFFAEGELPGRAAEEIPHPLVTETLAMVAELPAEERAKLNLEFTEIRAPFAGIVQGLDMVTGEIVSVGVPVCTIYNNDLLEAAVSILEADLGHLAPGRHGRHGDDPGARGDVPHHGHPGPPRDRPPGPQHITSRSA